MQKPVTLSQLEAAEQAVRDHGTGPMFSEQETYADFHFGTDIPTGRPAMQVAACKGCDANTAVDGMGYCLHCASDREALHAMDTAGMEAIERMIGWGLMVGCPVLGATVAVLTKLAGWW